MRRSPEQKFTLRFLIDLYDAFLREPSIEKVGHTLGVDHDHNGSLHAWLKRYPDLKMVKELADERRGNTHSMANYVLGKLSPEARKIWDQMKFWLEGEMPEKITHNLSETLRKELFIHALIHTSYNISRACQLVGIRRDSVANWTTQDPEFRHLMLEVNETKKDFFENALMDLVEERYPGAVLFVNRTINRDRGYGEQMVVDHTGNVGVTGIDLESLDLDLETRRKILDAVRRKKAEEKKVNGEVIDVETKLIPETAQQ